MMSQPHSRKGVKVQTKTYTTEKEAKKAAARRTGLPLYACRTAAMGVSRLEISFRRVHARLVAGR